MRIKTIGLLLCAVLLCGMLQGCPSPRTALPDAEQESFKDKWGETLFSKGESLPEVPLAGQSGIVSYYVDTGMFSYNYIPENRRAKTPEDLRGILMVEETEKLIGYWTGSGRKEYEYAYAFYLIDPYTGSIIDRGHGQQGDHAPNDNTLWLQLEEMWEKYLYQNDHADEYLDAIRSAWEVPQADDISEIIVTKAPSWHEHQGWRIQDKEVIQAACAALAQMEITAKPLFYVNYWAYADTSLWSYNFPDSYASESGWKNFQFISAHDGHKYRYSFNFSAELGNVDSFDVGEFINSEQLQQAFESVEAPPTWW